MDKIKDDDAIAVAANKNKNKVKNPNIKTLKLMFGKGGSGSSNSDDDDDESEEDNSDGEKKEKSKMVAPKYLFIFDDISDQLRKKGETQKFLKIHRHLKSKVIISSQYPSDLDPATRTQIDIWCIFKGFSKAKMEDVFPQLDIFNMEFEDFYSLYRKVTAKDHNFLYINRNKNQLRENFNQEIFVNKDII